MKTDRELLELAAKAAGLKVEWRDSVKCLCYSRSPYDVAWNSLTDDGDCARLEADLSIRIQWFGNCAHASIGYDGVSAIEHFADHRNNRQAARRRASVMCAAAIGEAMQ